MKCASAAVVASCRSFFGAGLAGLVAAMGAAVLGAGEAIPTPGAGLEPTAPAVANGWQIVLKQPVVDYGAPLTGTVTLMPAPGVPATVRLKWTDSFNRVVAEVDLPVAAGVAELPFSLATTPSLTMANRLQASLHFPAPAAAAPQQGPVASPAVEFIVTPEYAPFDDYQTIMYYAYKDNQQLKLRDVGITAGMNQARSRILDATRQKTRVWWGYNYRYYCEQILPDIYAEYHRHHEGADKNIRLKEAKELYKKDKSKIDAFIRKPCFLDPEVRKKIEDVMTEAVRINRVFAPLFYSLADEAGVADLPTAWDFCYDPRTLEGMREWLKKEYKTVEGVNAEWGTAFKSWEEVTPLTTDQMMKRGDDNFSSWADHRTFMEMCFAEAVKWGTDATLKADPKAYVGLVGCQMPSCFGGYDYWRLSQVMNIIEPYNIGNNREIWRSFRPEAPALTTSFGTSNQENWRLWHQLLHGDRGIIIYDEKNTYLEADGSPTKLGAEVTAPYRELTGGICKLLAHSTPVNDPVAIHYSQASIHAHWMLEARPGGEKWMERGSASERKQSEFLRLRESFTKLIEDQQLQYRFVAYAQLEAGELAKNAPKVLLLPQSIAMSAKEVKAVEDFVVAGGVVVADSRCGLMDEHCKRLKEGQLDKLFGITRANQDWKPAGGEIVPKDAAEIAARGLPNRALKLAVTEPGVSVDGKSGAKACYTSAGGVPAVIVRPVGKGLAVYLNLDLTNFHRWRLKPGEDTDARELVTALTQTAAQVTPWIKVSRADGQPVVGVEAFTWTNGPVKLLALHRNPQLRVNELGPPEYQSLKAFEDTVELNVEWAGAAVAVYDVRKGKLLADKAQKVTITQEPFAPTVLALFPAAVTGMTVEVPEKLKRGEGLAVKLNVGAPVAATVAAATHVMRLQVVGPDGKDMPLYARNVLAENGAAAPTVWLAVNDPAGVYTVRVHDLLTGFTVEKKVAVE